MIKKVEIEDCLKVIENQPLIDVRSPGEFAQGHIPGAINLPLFDNEERAIVGTIYKNSGRDAAVLKGFEIAGPKMAGFVKKIHQLAPRKELLIHCWRGGMRSEHMAWLFDQCGFTTSVLDGGYKSYRRYIRESFLVQANIKILGGMTGSSKTDILWQLEKMGEQVLDLERLSCHKGSAFGALGQEKQPTNEQFENNIYKEWQKFDKLKSIWIEDESRSIGLVNIPDPLFEQMTNAPMIMIELEKSLRIDRLVTEYAGFDKSLLTNSVNKIAEKLGGTRTLQALVAIDSSDFKMVVELVLGYYDKAYLHSIERRKNKNIDIVVFDQDDPEKNAKSLLTQTSH